MRRTMGIQDIQIDLEPITAPPPIPAWPPQPGWYVIGAILLMGIVFLLREFYLKRKRNEYRKISLQELEKVKSMPIDEKAFRQLNLILKSTALYAFKREKVASLTGKAWLQFLESSCSSIKLTDTSAKVLVNSMYNKNTSLELTPIEWKDILTTAAVWIKDHKGDSK